MKISFLKKSTRVISYKFNHINNFKFSIAHNNLNKTNTNSHKDVDEKEKYFSEYLKNFNSITKYRENLKLLELITTKEYLSGNYQLLQNRFDEAEKIFSSLKDYMRPIFISTHIYNVVIRRLAICKLNLNKIKEGLMELENAYEYSKDKGNFNYKLRLASKLELLKAYLKFDHLKAEKFAEEILTDEYEIKLLDPDELALVNTLAASAFFLTSSKSFEEIKKLLRRSINYTLNPQLKAIILNNLSVVLYYECKSHNKYLDNLKKINETKINNMKENENNLSKYALDEESRFKRKLSKQDLIFLQKEKKKIEKIKLSDLPSQDSYYKKFFSLFSQEFKIREKQVEEIGRQFEKNFANRNEEDFKIKEEVLKGSKFDPNEKVEVLLYNIENYGELKEQEIKILDSEVDYERDLDSLLPNLFISLKLNNNENVAGNQNNTAINNFSKNMSLENFLILYKPFFSDLVSGVENKNELEKNKEEELKNYLNNKGVTINVGEIEEFRDIIDKDEYFTMVKNPASTKTILFMAELFTENSKVYKEESEYFIKYAISLSLSSERFLNFIYNYAKDNKDKFDNVTYTLICHLLGALLKTRPKTKGEGLALLEMAKIIRNIQEAEERSFFLIHPEFSFNNDYDEETLKHISLKAGTATLPDSILNKFL